MREEADLSVHWLEFFSPAATLEARLVALRALIQARHIDGELTLNAKASRFVVVDVGKLHSEAQFVESVAITGAVFYDPRFRGDSHSAVFPWPGVNKWPDDRVGAYKFAISKLLADCCKGKAYMGIL